MICEAKLTRNEAFEQSVKIEAEDDQCDAVVLEREAKRRGGCSAVVPHRRHKTVIRRCDGAKKVARSRVLWTGCGRTPRVRRDRLVISWNA